MALSLAAVATAVSFATPAQGAAQVLVQLSCTDARKTFKINVTLEGSGAPTATYNVSIRTTDYIDDTRAPKVRLISGNKDHTTTYYRWRTGAQGRSVISNWDTTLQQPKGLDKVFIEGTVNTASSDASNFYCTDYAPK
ncbi:hypothetical protein [Streptomyces sp. NL15-2K]|uniref:hypothetical protein n=1 Tax=Streptomyces sp. NL15-2K TaxID=376149 RepID=UPI000F58C0A3|nr:MULTISPECIES: hypothetical protein [Actinomycetes]WKX10769.1 hypothetical protein Q4V64_26005 [Kutzneria buriramensis]